MMLGISIYSVTSSVLLSMGFMSFFSGLLSVVWEYSLIIEWEVWSLNSAMISMSLVFDWMSLIFLGSVCLVSGCIMVYSEYYMEGEINFMRFSYILMGFVTSMWFLIVSPNMISLLLGWDGLGLTSYALVIFYQSESSCNAGMLTILSNRIGDVAILLSIGLMYSSGQFDFYTPLSKLDSGLVLLVLLAACTKSAQMPFSAWLPAAMAAPTPVSALVHSSTLVTAGVYLLIRFNNEVQMSGLNHILLISSSVTMLMAGLGAVGETDLKKVVALSTLSQLGLMVTIVSMGMKELAFFHLITHAMFKSTLFMCVGFMIHSVKGSQDSRAMSGFKVGSPSLGLMLGVTNLALCGFPFLAGFYSKDSVLEYVLSMNLNCLVTLMMVAGVGLTVGYSLRVLRLSVGKSSGLDSVSGVSDLGLVTVKSVLALFLMSVGSGFFVYWVCMPISTPSVLTSASKFTAMLVSLVSGLVMFNLLNKSVVLGKGVFKIVENLLVGMWFLVFLSTKLTNKLFINLGGHNLKMLDMGWFEYYGGQGGRLVLVQLSKGLQEAQKNSMVGNYLISAMICGFFFCLVV
uniref:NADH-ubiquinone oxidoreductase chain 5 n=1 Tax=Linevichella vortex TaxID=686705 RepID=A0A1L5BWA8_9CRUS|nr:NADH dehydrogenase subunit 5 [Linevichella vortex]